MRGRGWLSLVGACSVLLVTSRARAQCTMDTECMGESVCENGHCVAPVASPPVAAAPPAAAPSVTTPSAAVAPAPLSQPTMVRHSTVMMTAGILMTALAGGALLVAGGAFLDAAFCSSGALFGKARSKSCNNDGVIYGSLLTAGGLVAAGVPLIVIGARREPAKLEATAAFTPWAMPTSVGVGLRISM